MQSAVRAIKREVPGLLVVTDVCLCEYTSHGHCGIVVDEEIANDPTVEQLVRAALSHAAAGADIVAPSDMMDGRVGAIRDGARRARLSRHGDHVLRGEVLLGVLRSVPRGRRFGAGVRRPAIASDGSGQRGGGAARGRARHRGGRRHRDGQAGARLSRRHRAGEGRRSAIRRRRTRSAANTRCSRRRRGTAGSTSRAR